MEIMNSEPLIHQALSGQIIGATLGVIYPLRPALNEKEDENALVIDLRKRGHVVEQQKQFNVR